MPISPVSNYNFQSKVSFKGESDDFLQRPGKYSNPAAPAEQEVPVKKESHTGRNIGLSIAGIVAIAAALAGLTRGNILKMIPADKMEKAGIMEKVGHYLAKAGDFIAKYTYELIPGLAKKAENAEKAEKVVADAVEAVEVNLKA